MNRLVAAAQADAAERLAAAGIDNPRLEARLLLAAALDVEPVTVFAHPGRPLFAEDEGRLKGFLERRLSREPLAHILGRREFWSLPFRVSPATLIPRPDSETLVQAALDWVRGLDCRAKPGNDERRDVMPGLDPGIHGHRLRLLDFGTGGGCLLLALLSEIPEATGLGIDASPEALEIARRNAADLGLADRAEFRHGNWGDGLEGPIDLILSNPPYIPSAEIAVLMPEVRDYEPASALDGGPDGLDAYRCLLPEIVRLLAPGGAAFLEVGRGQAGDVAALGRTDGLTLLGLFPDLAGIDRCVGFRK
jgi:release factor glutamine methyltransferase